MVLSGLASGVQYALTEINAGRDLTIAGVGAAFVLGIVAGAVAGPVARRDSLSRTVDWAKESVKRGWEEGQVSGQWYGAVGRVSLLRSFLASILSNCPSPF